MQEDYNSIQEYVVINYHDELNTRTERLLCTPEKMKRAGTYIIKIFGILAMQ